MKFFETPKTITNSKGSQATVTKKLWDNGTSFRVYVSYKYSDGSGGQLGYFDRKSGEFVDQSKGSAERAAVEKILAETKIHDSQ